MINKVLYSIGYANKSLKLFLECLKQNKINCIIDVRSSPYSKQYPEYNKEALAAFLKDNNILYINFKNEFGARRLEDTVYKHIKTYDKKECDVVIFEKVWETKEFQNGYNRILEGLNKGFNICFMCSEKHAYECHRGLMVCEYFYNKGFIIKHIEDENTIIEHKHIKEKLEELFDEENKKFNKMYQKMTMYGGNLFTITNEAIDAHFDYWQNFFNNKSTSNAHYLQNIKIGYKRGVDEND